MDEVRVEAERIAALVGLEFTDLQAAVKRLRDQGVVLPRGRYLYVSPDLLAISAAAQLWDERGPELIQVIADLPGAEPRMQLLRRLTTMAEHPAVRAAVEQLLGTDGLYKSLGDLDKPFLSEVFRFLASALPQDAMTALGRLLEDASDEDLLGFKQGRRDVIWTIESLLRWPATSLKAARMLMRLSLCETEGFGNNSTGILTSYFDLFLSGSPLPLMERFVLIDELLESKHPQSRQLAVRLATASLNQSSARLARDVDNLSQKRFPPEWRPKTWGEIWETRRKALAYLEQIAQKTDEAASMARQERLKSVHVLALGGQVEDAIEVVESARPTTDEERRLVLQSCDQLSQVPNLSAELNARITQVRQTAFSATYFDRLRRWAGRRLHSDFDALGESGYAHADRQVVDLAEEGYAKGIGLDEIEWLSSGEAENVWPYGKRLGELDRSGDSLTRIIDAAPDDINCMLLVSYLSGQGSWNTPENRESIIDMVGETKPVAAFGVTWRGEPTKAGAGRIIRLVGGGRISASMLRVLKYGGWVEKLPTAYAVKIINLMLAEDSGESGEAVLGIIDHAARSETISVDVFGDAVWQALRSRPRRRSHTFDWQWARVAELVVAKDPARLAEIFVTFFESDDTWLDTDSAQGVLASATNSNPSAVWRVMGPALLRDDLTGVRLRIKLNHWYGELIPAEILVTWAQEHGRRGFLIAASLLNVKSGHPSDSARLLVRTAKNPKEVLNLLFSGLHTGVFTGAISAHMERMLETLRTLAQDEEPRIRSWAKRNIANAEKSIRRQKLIEEEEEF